MPCWYVNYIKTVHNRVSGNVIIMDGSTILNSFEIWTALRLGSRSINCRELYFNPVLFYPAKYFYKDSRDYWSIGVLSSALYSPHPEASGKPLCRARYRTRLRYVVQNLSLSKAWNVKGSRKRAGADISNFVKGPLSTVPSNARGFSKRELLLLAGAALQLVLEHLDKADV